MRADKGYRGEDVIRTARDHGLNIVCTKSNAGGAIFIPAPGRWGVERSTSWLDNCRRLVRDYERECTTATNMTVTADIYRLLRFLWFICSIFWSAVRSDNTGLSRQWRNNATIVSYFGIPSGIEPVPQFLLNRRSRISRWINSCRRRSIANYTTETKELIRLKDAKPR